MAEITKEMEEKYLKDSGMICPYCGHGKVKSGEIYWETALSACAIAKCQKCNKEWKDLYSIVGIREIK